MIVSLHKKGWQFGRHYFDVKFHLFFHIVCFLQFSKSLLYTGKMILAKYFTMSPWISVVMSSWILVVMSSLILVVMSALIHVVFISFIGRDI